MSTSRNLQAALFAAALVSAAEAASAQARQTTAPAARASAPEVVERAANGRPTSVRIDGAVYKVCMSEREDGCIQPRAAGLNWGDRPLQHWPGQPASQTNRPARAPAR